jgi:hypothetical protein
MNGVVVALAAALTTVAIGIPIIIGGGVPVNTLLPAISGTAQSGQTVSCSTGSWTNSPGSFAYTWERDGSTISGQTASSLALTGTDVGTAVTCLVTATNGSGSSTPAESSPVSVFAAGTANLWVDTDGGTCTRSATPVAYSNAAACPPFTTRSSTDQAAITNASPGDMIMVKDVTGGDDYGKMILGPASKAVTIKAETTGAVEFSRAVIACSACIVEGFKFEARAPGSTADDDWVCQGPIPAGRGKSDFFVGGIVSVCATPVLLNDEIDGLRDHGVSGTCPKNGMDVSADQAGFTDETITSTTGFQMIGGSIHGIVNAKGINGGGDYVVISGVDFYNFGRFTDCDPDVHNECIYSTYMKHLVFRNNLLAGCPSGQGLALLGNCGSGYGDITIEGNVFARTNEGSGADYRNDWHPSGGGRSLFLGSSLCSIDADVVRYNTFETGPDADASELLTAGATKGLWYANLGASDCNPTLWTYSFNVGQTCSGASSVPLSPFANSSSSPNAMASCYVDAFNFNFRLVSGCAAINAGDPSRIAPPDRDGHIRGADGFPDPGAYEYVP